MPDDLITFLLIVGPIAPLVGYLWWSTRKELKEHDRHGR